MKFYTLTVLAFLILFFGYVSAQKGRRDRKRIQITGNSLQKVTTCLDQPIDFKTSVESSVEKCLDARVKQAQEKGEAEAYKNGKGGKNKKQRCERKKAKLGKRIRKRCVSECEWSGFNMIPEVGNSSKTYPSMEIPAEFLNKFPEGAKESLKTGMKACFNTTSPIFIKLNKVTIFSLLRSTCLNNTRLVKCFMQTIRKTCRGKTGTIKPPNVTQKPGGTKAPNLTQKPGTTKAPSATLKPGTTNATNVSQKATTTKAPAVTQKPALTTPAPVVETSTGGLPNGSADDGDVESDGTEKGKKNDDESFSDSDNSSEKESSPGTTVDTSERITK